MPVQQDILYTYAGLQSKLGNNECCHFLVLCSIAHEYRKKPVDVLGLLIKGLKEGWVKEDLYVEDSLAFLHFATGARWVRREVTQLPEVILENEFTEVEWYNARTKKVHYTRRYVDPYTNSVTVKEGKIRSYRIYTAYKR